MLDQVTGEPTLEGDGEARLRLVFRVFGIAHLDPLSHDFETVLNTWTVVLGKVGKHLRALNEFGRVMYDVDVPHWHPAFKAYIDALWAGDASAVLKAAEVLGITAGIPEGSPALARGPLPRV